MDEETLKQLMSDSQVSGDVRLAFGESRQVGEKTIIPVAAVAGGQGSGFGAATCRMAGAAAENCEVSLSLSSSGQTPRAFFVYQEICDWARTLAAV